MTGTIINRITGDTIKVHVAQNHPDSHYGKPVWVDDENRAYLQVGMEDGDPIYSFDLDEPFKTRLRIGRQLYRERERRSLTTRDLHNLCGVHHSNISAIERGKNSTSVDTLVRLATELGLELNLVPKK